MKKISKIGITIVFTLALVGGLFYPLDYYIYKPGSTYNTADFVTVDGADQDDEGSFNLTTVALMKGTPLTYAMATVRDFYEIRKIEDVRMSEEDDEEYEVRQIKMMDDSKFNAVTVAYKLANKEVDVNFKGLYVLNVYKGSAADGVILPGDTVVEVNNKRIESMDQFQKLITPLKKGEKFELVIDRNSELLTKTIELREIPGANGRIGIGITYNELKTIQSDPHVELATEDIGGPSAGLMFTLEILNQLVDEDLTKGYDIAGTGEMNPDGTVGRIGGIEKKIVSSHKEGKDYFFAPDDEISDSLKEKNPTLKSNYEAAVATAKKIGTTMEIVPVKTIDDALSFLRNLEPKN